MPQNIENLTHKIDSLNNKVDNLLNIYQDTGLVGKRWLRTDEVCKYLSISVSQLQVLRSEGTIPVNKIGGTNFYDRLVIDQILENSGEV